MTYKTKLLQNGGGERSHYRNYDRFIPSSSSHSAYRASNSFTADQDFTTLATNSSRLSVAPSQVARGDNNEISRTSQASSTPLVSNNLSILNILGSGSSLSRVFSFRNPAYKESPVAGSILIDNTIIIPRSEFLDTSSLESSPDSEQFYQEDFHVMTSLSATRNINSRISLRSLKQELRSLTVTPVALTRGGSLSIKKPKTTTVLSHIPYRILDAPRLRIDFYSNLVAWSQVTGQVVVGLGTNVYIWTEPEGAKCLNLANIHSPVMSLAISDKNILMIGYKNGRVTIFDIKKNKVNINYNNIKNGICCGLWNPGSSTYLFVGDEIGNVLCLRVITTGTPETATVIDKFSDLKAHGQQICGMAISPDGSQIAIGGNDNLCTVWNIRDLSKPKLQYRLQHKAAVKALAFCPWSSALLATGGGSFDRTIRFWHTNSGTLLESLEVQGQVTSLVWSKYYRQIAATFGFSNPTEPKLVSVYSFPKCIPLIQVPSIGNLRVLSAVLSPDGACICLATNDESIRFYELWATKGKKPPHILDYPQSGMFGSDIIELEEGIDKNYDIVR